MQSRFLRAVFALCLLDIQQINCDLSSCNHYLKEDGTAYPLDICTAQSIQGEITSTTTICDPKSSSTLLHQTFSGEDCDQRSFLSEQILDSEDKIISTNCFADDCAVSFRSYSNQDCNSDFTDLAFVRGSVYTEMLEESIQKCTVYECFGSEELEFVFFQPMTSASDNWVDISEIDCDTQTPYIQSTYWEHVSNCDISPLHCGSFTSTDTEEEISSTGPPIPELTISELFPEPYSYYEYSNLPEGEPEEEFPDRYTTTTSPTTATLDTSAMTRDNTASMRFVQNDSEQQQLVVKLYSYYSLPAIPIACICFTFVFMILLGFVYFLFFDETTKQSLLPLFKVFTICSIGCNAFGIMCIICISVMMQMMTWDIDTYNMAIIPYYGSVIGYVGGKFFLESFFLCRVYISFQGSMFQLSTRMFVLLFIWMIIVSSMWLIVLIMDDESMHFWYIVIWAGECMFIITVLCIFTNGLHKLLVQTGLDRTKSISQISQPVKPVQVSVPTLTESQIPTANSPGEDSVSTEDQETVNEMSKWKYICCMIRTHVRSTKVNISSQKERLSLIYLMTRCVVLSSISLLSTAIFGIFMSMQSSIDIQSIYILFGIWSIDITINSWCLFLNFRFTDGFYKKCCSPCHGSCQNMLEYISASKIVHNEAVNSLSDLRSVKTISK